MRRPVARLSSLALFIMTAGVGAVLVAWWLTQWRVQPHPHVGLSFVAGAVLIVLGLIPPINAFARYARAGGTPIPGAMTTELVVAGFNGYVRNPIYLGALMIFVGEAALLWQVSLLVYSLVAWLGMAAFVRWYEEPTLVRRFGADYVEYRHSVPAWIPRRHPWVGPGQSLG